VDELIAELGVAVVASASHMSPPA